MTTPPDSRSVPAVLQLAENGKTNFIIVKADGLSPPVVSTIVKMRSEFQSVTGAEFSVETDILIDEADSVYEILIGCTNRIESKKTTELLRQDDYTVEVVGNIR